MKIVLHLITFLISDKSIPKGLLEISDGVKIAVFPTNREEVKKE